MGNGLPCSLQYWVCSCSSGPHFNLTPPTEPQPLSLGSTISCPDYFKTNSQFSLCLQFLPYGQNLTSSQRDLSERQIHHPISHHPRNQSFPSFILYTKPQYIKPDKMHSPAKREVSCNGWWEEEEETSTHPCSLPGSPPPFLPALTAALSNLHRTSDIHGTPFKSYISET